MNNKWRRFAEPVMLFLKGIVIGVANIIPGVSGGTMALVLGIYKRLINAIRSISLKTIFIILGVFTFKKDRIAKFRDEMKRIDITFLVVITLGAIVAVLALAKLMTYLLEKQHDPTYGFFFGLVLVSVIVPFKYIRKKTAWCFISCIIAIFLVVGLSQSLSGERMYKKALERQDIRTIQEKSLKNTEFETEPLTAGRALFLLFAGAAAISAMILPGVSGSFLLLLLGVYFDILKAIVFRQYLVLLIVAAGCIIGIVLFTRLLNYLLNRWYDPTMGFLMGLVIGSLWAIWPFKTYAVVGEETIYLSNKIPSMFSTNEIMTIITFIVGSIIVLMFIWLERRMEHKDLKTDGT